jgi:hypothetical protein
MVSFHKWMVGLALAIIMLSALGINALLFSARNFQFNLAQVAPATNGIISVQELMGVDAQIKEIVRSTEEPRGALIQVQQELATLEGELTQTEAQVNASRAEVAGGLAALESKAGVVVAEAAATLDADALQGRIMALAQQSGLAPSDQQAVAALRGQAEQLSKLEDSLTARDGERARLVAQQRLVGGQVAEADRRVFALKQSVVSDYESYDRIRSEVMALRATSPLGVGSFLVQAHPTFMSTILVLLMGALGAILYLFPAYMSRETPVTFAEIAVRLIFGMVTALAFYIVANATLAGFSFVPGQSASGSAAMLNPFTVSLIGVIAGVMADDIARWIKNRGSELFGASPAAAPTASTPRPAPSQPAAAPAYEEGGVNPHGGLPPV